MVLISTACNAYNSLSYTKWCFSETLTNFATLSVALWVTLPDYSSGVAHSTFSEWGKLHFLLLYSNSVQNNDLPPSPYSLLLNIPLCIFTPKGTEAVLEPLLLLSHVRKFCLAERIYL